MSQDAESTLQARPTFTPSRWSFRQLRSWLTVPHSDVRLWFTGLNEVFSGFYLDEYPANYKFSIQAPWPQPSPHDPLNLPPTVLHVPEGEISDFLNRIVDRYVRTLRDYWPRALAYSIKHPKLETCTDEEFVHFMTDTPLVRCISETLDARDEALFADVRKPRGGKLIKVDSRILDGLDTLPEMHNGNGTALLHRNKAGEHTLLAIAFGKEVFTPADGDHWTLAKSHLLQGATLALILGMHPRIHFPCDPINALSKTILPPEHTLSRLLAPHHYMQLPLDFAVLYIDRSVAHNNQREIYTPFTLTRGGFLTLMSRAYKGMRGNSATPAYRFRLGGEYTYGRYGEFLSAYYEVILAFVEKVLADVPEGDPAIKRWADEISRYVPGFPNGRQIFEGDTLAQTVATYIHNVSVVHSADHHAYAVMPVNKVPLRMRVPAPSRRRKPLLDKALRRVDIFRHRMAREMYFKTITLKPLSETRYDFPEEHLQALARQFLEAIEGLDCNLPGRRYIPLSKIATSIQF